MSDLIEPLELEKAVKENNKLVIVDVRWYLSDITKGRKEWEKLRIPGAIFLDMDHDLSDKTDTKSGRHPLPSPEAFAQTLTKNGIEKDSFIVVYDDMAGAIAARFWWMLRWIKGPDTNVLNGGFQAWKALGLPVESGPEKILNSDSNPIIPEPQSQMFVSKIDVLNAINSQNILIVDARDKERYLGIIEPIDPIGGHIPGAINSPYKENLTNEEIPKFQSPKILKTHFEAKGITSGKQVISYCGSGVTACHNILALELAGFTGAKLYPGSWSEWCQDTSLKIETE